MNVLGEAVFVGLIVLVVGTLVSNVMRMFTKNSLPAVCKSWNKNHVMEIALFLTGFVAHLLLEALGLNKWYCKRGAACRK